MAVMADPARATSAVPLRRRVLLIAVLTLIVLIAGIGLSALRSSQGPEKMMGESRTTVSHDGTRIAFTKMGSGPPVVLVDGAFCYRENGPTPQVAPLLAKHFTVFAYDRRGRGESGDTKPYSIQHEVEDLQAIIDQAGGSASLFGVSSGAALALQAAASGVNVKKLALYEPPYISNDGKPQSLESKRKQIEQLVAAGDRAGAVRFFMAEVFGAPRAFVFAMPFIMRGAWQKNELVAHTLPYDLTILDDWSVLGERRGSITVPVLVIGGEKSPKTLHDAVLAVANALPTAHSRFLAGQTHNVSATAVGPVLTEFFNAK